MKIDRCDNCGSVLVQRTLEQNDKYHACVQDIAEQIDWPRGSGRKISVDAWKQLISAAFERAEGRGADVYPAIDGQGIDVVYAHSSRRGKKRMSSLIEYTIAWGTEENVRWTEEPERQAA